LRDYEQLLHTYATDYKQVRHENVDNAAIARFFAPSVHQSRSFTNAQELDYDGLESRLLSSSYTPAADHPNRALMLVQLRELFARAQQGGRVRFEYDTRAHFGHLT